VPNAKVTIKNTGTNAETTVMTDGTGYFRVGKLQPATYTVSVDAQGFAPFKAENVIVQLGSVTDVTAHLNVASAGATIVVSAEVPQVNTNSQEFAPTLDQNAISNLPSTAAAGPASHCSLPARSMTPVASGLSASAA